MERLERFILTALVAVTTLFGAGSAFAAVYDAQVDVTAPTTRSDGSPLAPSDIASYRVFFDCSTTPVQQGGDIAGPPPFNIASFFPADGVYEVCVQVVDTDGQVSAMSNIFTADVSEVAGPSPATLDSISVSCPSGAAPRIVSQTASSVVLECDAP